MGFGGNNKRRGPIGVSLTGREVYLAQRVSGEGYRFAVETLAEGTDPSSPAYHTEVSRAIAAGIRRGKFAGKDVVSALPAESLQYKTLRLPPMPEEDLVQAVAWEAAERFQITDACTLQHYNAGEVRQGNENRQEVILLAATASEVYDHALAVKRAGLMPIAIDATGAALARLLGGVGKSTLIIHLGEKTAEIVGARDGRVIFDKPIQLVRDNGLLDTAALVRELGLCLRYLSVTFGIHKPDQSWVSGLGGGETLAVQLGESLHTTTRTAAQSPALQGVNFPGSDPSPWLVALGLALRDETATPRQEAA